MERKYNLIIISELFFKRFSFRKEWFICPPEENLLPTRIPYEESSIYSKLNLFSPDSRKFPGNLFFHLIK